MALLSDISVVGPGTKLVIQASWNCVTGLGPSEDEVRAAFFETGISVSKIEETLVSGPTFRQVFVSGVALNDFSIGELRALLKEELRKKLGFGCSSPNIGSIETERIIRIPDVPVTTTISLASIAAIALAGLVVFTKIMR